MAVSINLPGGAHQFRPSSLENYSVVEDITPMDPNSLQGGYGQITFDILKYPDYRLLRGKRFELLDSIKGKTSGIITEFNRTDENLSVTTDSALGVLNSWKHVRAFTGAFDELIAYWFSLVDLNLNVVFEGDIGGRPVTTQSFIGNLWDHIKQLLAAHAVEMALVFNTVHFRHFGHSNAVTDRLETISTTVAQGETAKMVEIAYYNNKYEPYGELYPPAASYDIVDSDDPEQSSLEPTIMQVDAGEIVEYNLQLQATPISVDTRPTAVDWVNDEVQSSSVYTVVGNDDLPVPAAQWTDRNGWVRIRISKDDPTQLVARVRGASLSDLAPFRIAMSSGEGNYYNSLHIMGEGTRFEEEIVTIHTGASTDTTGTEVGATVRNPYVQTLSDALSTGVHTAAAFSGFDPTLDGTALNINRKGMDEGIRATIYDFNQSW